MEIIGNVVKVTDEFIRLRTVQKKQEIDVFYPESKKFAIRWRYEPHMITTIEVEPESIDIDGCKFAKLWFKFVVTPNLNIPEDMRNEGVIRIIEAMKKLYKNP